MYYHVLLFEPNIPENYNPTILWKAQIQTKPYVKSINFALINDNIEYNNRRTLLNWYDFFKENNITYEFEFDSKYAKNLVIIDGEVNFFNVQLFACDIRASNYFVEVEPDFIISILHILDLKKSGIIFPTILAKKVEGAKKLLENNHDLNTNTLKPMINYLNILEKLIDHCSYYEHDIKFHIVER